jgi:hypothetical protein
VTRAVLDDHLVRDLLADDIAPALGAILADHEPATTNLYLFRLCKSVVSAPGGALTSPWSPEQRRALGKQLTVVQDHVEVMPMRALTYRMAEIGDAHRVSTLGAEAIAAAEHLGAPLCVWSGDDGPAIRGAMQSLGHDYRTVER